MEGAQKLGLDIFYPPLTSEQTRLATADLVQQVDTTIPYPKILRSVNDKPVTNQSIGLLSLFLFKSPYTHVTEIPAATGETVKKEVKVLGFIKLRGNYVDKLTAEIESSKIIKEQDSRHKILLGPVGGWLPITDADEFVKEKLDVKTEKEKYELRDKKARKKTQEEERKIREIKEREELMREDERNSKARSVLLEEERKTRELREREELMREEERNDKDDSESINHYTARRVTEMKLYEQERIYERKILEIREKLFGVRKELKTLDEKYPSYDKEWLEVYNVARRKVKVPDFIPDEKNLEEYKNWKPE